MFNKSLITNVSLVTVSNFVSRGLGLLTFIIIAKHLSINDYSGFTIITAVLVTLTELINSGLNASVIRFTAIFKSKNEIEKIVALWSTTIINTAVISSILVIVAFFSKQLVNNVFIKSGNFENAFFIASFGIFTTFVFSTYSAVFQGLQKFKTFFWGSVLFGALRLIGALLLLMNRSISVNNLVILFSAIPLIPCIYFHIKLRDFNTLKLTYDKSILHETITFGRWMILWSIIAVIQSRLDIYFLGAFSYPEQVSYYDVATKFVSIPMGILGVIGTILNPKLSSLSKDKFNSIFKKLFYICTFVSIGIVAGIIIFPIVMSLVFETKYVSSYIPLRLQLIGLIPFAWSLPFTSAIFAIGKSKVFFITALISLFVNVIVSYLLIPKYGAIGSAMSSIVVNSIGFIYIFISYKCYFSGIRKTGQSKISLIACEKKSQ